MKKLLQSLCWWVVVLFLSTTASAQIQFKIEYVSATQRYQASMKPLQNWSGNQGNTGSAQVTLVVPTGGNFTPTAVQSQFGFWSLDNAIVRAPIENPGFDYISFYMPSAVSSYNYVANTEIPMFSFAASGACTGYVNLIDNQNDPFVPANRPNGTNSVGINVGNQISIAGAAGGLLGNAYTGNYAMGAQCPTTTQPCVIQYQIVKTGNTYQINMIPNVTYTGTAKTTASQQITLKVPSGLAYTNLSSLTAGANYTQGSRVNAPSQATNFDYIIFNLASSTQAINYTAGVSVPLLKFDVTGTCNGSIGFMANNDPFTANTSYNAKQQITVAGYGAPDAPICFVGSGTAPCPTAAASCAVQYQITKNGNTYQVNMIPNVSYSGVSATTVSQQVTIKVPSGLAYTNLTNLTSGANYTQGSRVNAPSQASGSDYIMFNLGASTQTLPYSAGTSVPLFKFDVTGTCNGSLALMPDNDPFTANASYNSNQQITISGYGAPDAPICFVGTGSVPCPTATPSCAIQYQITKTGNTYQVNMIPNVSYTGASATTVSQQVTLKVPNGLSYTNFVNLTAGANYTQGSRVNSPSQASGSDYIMFNLGASTQALPYSVGASVPLFKFDVTGTCNGSLDLMTDSDAFTANSSYNSKQQITISGYGAPDAPICFVGTGSAPCPAAVTCAIQYEITKTGNTYQIDMIPNVTYVGAGNTTASQQVTLKVPTGLAYANLVSLTSGANYVQGSRVNAPTQAPGYDYIMFNLSSGTQAITYTSGQRVPLFKFDVSGSCTGDLSFMTNSDPFMNNTSYNAKQQITIAGYGVPDAPICFVGTGTAPCPTALPTCPIQYQLETVNGCEYQVSMIPNVNWTDQNGGITKAAKVTLRVPHNCFQVSNLTSLNFGADFTIVATQLAPADNPNYDYICFSMTTVPTVAIPYVLGQKVPLFTFKNGGTCCGDIELMPSTDPFAHGNSLNLNFDQYWQTSGTGSSGVEPCIIGTAQPCIPANGVTNLLGNDVTICQGASTNLSVTGTYATYSWSPATGLSCTNCANPVANPTVTTTYSVTATTASGCPLTDQIVVSVTPAPSNIGVNVANSTSCVAGNGSIIVNATGSGTLEYSINNGTNWQTSNSFSNLSAGSYTVMVRTQGNNCTTAYANNPVTISSAVAPTITSVVPSNPLDCGVNNGTITINASGTGTPFSYSIDNGTSFQNSNVFNNLAAGTYKVVVKSNSTGCQSTAPSDITLTAPVAATIVSATPTETTDCSVNDGTITVVANGGTPPLEYSINGTTWQQSNIFTNLAAGSYIVRVRNSNNTCVVTANAPVVVNMPPMPSITSLSSTAPTVCGTNNGTIIVSGTGGQGQLEYSIDGTSWQTGGTFTGLASGTYYVYVRNQDNTCPKPYSGNPVVLNAAQAPTIVNVEKTDPTNCGLTNGSIVITATGNGTLEYSINGGTSYQASNTFNNLAGGTYNIRVRVVGTGTSCVTSSNNIVLTQPTQAIILGVTPTATSDCGQNDGTITINASGGIAPLQYSIDNGVTYQANNIFTGIAAGTYTIKVRNANATCEVPYSTPIVVTQPNSATITNAMGTPATCGQNNGSITITATGGIAPLQYSINGTTWQTSNVFNNIAGGTYNIYVRNNGGTCVKQHSSTVNISGTGQPTITNVASTNVTDCSLNNGTITVTATGGNTPLQYSKDGGSTWQASNVFSGLSAGTYNIMVRNADNSCPATASPVTITVPTAPTIASVQATNPTDCGLNDGTITVLASGTGALQYSINGTTWQTSNVFTNVSAGAYTIYVRNADATCVVQTNTQTTITNQILPVINNVSSTNPTACGLNDGTITINSTPNAGVQYSINGVNWQTANVFTNLAAGSYTVRVRYSSGLCTVVHPTPVNIIAASGIQIIQTVVYNPTACTNVNDGSITIYATGGNGLLQYSINNGTTFQISNTFTNLAAGVYNIIVKDGTGACQSTTSATLVAPTAPTTPTGTATPTANCFLSNGSITVTAPLGANYEYSINNGATWQTTTTFANLAAGTYAIIARTIGTSCTAVSAPIVVNMPAMPTISDVQVSFAVSGCQVQNGEIHVVVNNAGTWEYSIDGGATWQSSPTFSNVPQGSYNVMVRNANSPSCYKPYQGNPVQITAPTAPSILSIIPTNPTTCNGTNGTITINASSSASLEYSIDNGVTYQPNNIFTNLSSGFYQIKVRDDNGCVTNGTPVTLNGNTAPTGLTANATPATDCNLNNGTIVVSNVVGGTAPYEYSINGITWQTSNVFLNVVPGSYFVRVRNLGGSCIYTNATTTVVTQPTAPIYNNVTSTPATCGATNGSIVISASTGALFSIDGINYQTSGTFANLAPGSYTVFISNANGTCKTAYPQNPVILSSGQAVNITNITVTHPANCAVNGTGTVTITVSGGTSPYQYSIDGGVTFQNSNVFTGVIPGSYSVVVKGSGTSANCPTTNIPIIVNPSKAPQIVAVSPTNPTQCLANGSITVLANGGIAPLQYSIDGVNWQISNIFNNLAAGSYVIYVRNADGTCTQVSSTSTVLAQPVSPTITNIAKVNPNNCNSTNGSITVTSNPSTGVQYSINGIHWQTSNVFTNIAAGAYTVFVRYIDGSCSTPYTSNPVLLNGSGAPTIVAVDKTKATDCNKNDGTITVHVSNTNAQYRYSIDNGLTYQLSNYFTNLAPGTYTIRVTDLLGNCPTTFPNVVITAPALPSITSVNATPVSNCGTNTGSIAITATGGSTLQYSIDNGINWSSSNIFNNLPAGDYVVKVRNIDGTCVTLYPASVMVGEPTKPTISTVVPVSPTACGVNNGTITITATGGTGSYEYSINNISWQSSNQFTGLAAGTYIVYVRNAGTNCPVAYNIPTTLTPTGAPSILLVNPENPTTCNGADGKITITATGGSGSLEYSINNGASFQSSNVFTGLVAGTYTVIVRNVGGSCSTTYPSVSLVAPTPPNIITAVATPTSDCNGTDGKVTIVATGQGILEYSIDGINWFSTNTIAYLPTGTYTPRVRVLGTNCVATGTAVVVTQPTTVPSVTAVSTNPTACGSNNGSITITGSGGTAPLQYSIDGINWQTSNAFNNLPAGTYFAFVRNANGTCATPYAQNPIYLNPGASAPIISSVAHTNVTDCNKTDGTITINATGGTAPLQYSIDGGATWQTSNIFNNLPAGSYEIVVRNADGTCVVQHVPVVITAPTSPTLLNVNVKNPTDCGLTNGQVTILAAGSGSIQYSIDSMKTWSYNNIFPNIGTGKYYIFVRNANGTCPVASPNNPFLACEFDLALKKLLAPNQDSIVRLGRDVDFQIKVYNQGVLTARDIEVTDYIPRGMILSPNDNNGWSYFPALAAGTFVNPNNALKVKKVIAGPLVSKDSITINIKLRPIFGGPNTRLVNVAEISSAKDINGVPRQDVDSYADDTKGNDKQKDNVIVDKNVTDEDDEDPAPIRFDDYDPHGYIYCDKSGGILQGGQIQLLTAPPGGTIYFANDVNGQPLNGSSGTYQFFTNGVPGTYTFTYVHPFGYQLSTSILPQTGSFNPAGTDGTAIDKDGQINNIVTLGSEQQNGTLLSINPIDNPYYLSITLNANEPTLISNNNIPVGCACINSIVCQDVNNNGIAEPNEPGVNGVTVQAYDCTTNQIVGSAVTANGGKYIISGLLSGTYKLKFTLPNGYSFVTNGQPISVDNQGFTNCFPLGYSGCESKPVCVAACPTVTISPNVTICEGSNTNLVANGGTSYTWSPALGLNTVSGSSVTASPSATTVYTVTVTNTGSCSSTASVTVTVVNKPSNNFTVTATQPTDCSISNGTITITNAQPNLEFSINNGNSWQTSTVFNNVAQGTYIVLARFAGTTCPTAYPNNPVTITTASAPTITNVTPVNPNNCENPNGRITIFATGNAALQYSINGGATWETSNVFNNLAAGIYNVAVRYTNSNCISTFPAITLVINQPVINAVNVVGDCANNNRSITILASGGQPPLEYSIDNGQTWFTNNVFSNLAAGYYTIKVRNFNGTCVVPYGNQPIGLCAFDLALKKTLAPGQSAVVRLGDVINYQVKVYNQGSIPATNVSVVDYVPRGMQIFPSGNNGWVRVNDTMATNLVAGPINPGDSVTLNLSMRLVFGSPNTSLKNFAEIKDARDNNGNAITDIDSTPDMVKSNDTVKDNVTNENGKGGGDEDDHDPADITLDNFDPSGYIYCEKTGKIMTGGKMKLLNKPQGGDIFFTTDNNGQLLDGRTGMYQIFTNGVSGTYTFSYEHPNGYPLSTTCLPEQGSFNPAGKDGNIAYDKDGVVNGMIHLGSISSNGALVDKSCNANKYYFSFTLEANEKTLIATNNIPVSCAIVNGKICNDINNDGIPQSGEPGIAGMTVLLFDCKSGSTIPLATTKTDANGNYSFDGLVAGQYKVQLVTATGQIVKGLNFNANGVSSCKDVKFGECLELNACISNCPTINNVLTVMPWCPKNNGVIIIDAVCQGDLEYSIDGGKTYQHLNAFINLAPGTYTIKVKSAGCEQEYKQVIVLACENNGGKGSISGKAFKDCSGNGYKGTNKGMANIKVTLSGASTQTTTTDANGRYSFNNIDAGNYTVTFEKPTGFEFSAQNQGSDDNNDSDVASNGSTSNITLAASQLIDNVDAGLKDVQGPTISFTHPWLVGKKDGDNIYMECGEEYFFSAKDATLTDNCDKNPTVKFGEDPAIFSKDCEKDKYLVKMHCGWIAKDECGNTSQIWFNFFVRDTKAPDLVGVPANITVASLSAVPAPANVTAKDQCDKAAKVIFDESQAGNVITRTWTAIDACGNKSTGKQIITIIQNNNGCKIQNPPVAVTSPASCGLKDGKAKMAPNNFSFLWSDGSTTDTRLDLAAGTYIVTVTDAQGCTAEVAVKILDGCGQVLVLSTAREVKQVACSSDNNDYCIDIDLLDLYLGGYEIYDNGVSMKNNLTPCELRRHHEYNLDGVDGYNKVNIESWTVKGQIYKGQFNSLDELLQWMNQTDKGVTWKLDKVSNTIYTSYPEQNRYGNLVLKLTDGSNLSWNFGVNEYTSAHGLKIPVSLGEHRIELVHKLTNYRDTTLYSLVCTNTETFEYDLLEGDLAELDLRTKELVGTKCAIKICAEEKNNPVAEFLLNNRKGPEFITIEAMERGWENRTYTMCDEFNVCDTAIVKVSVREKIKHPDPIDSTIVIYNAFSPNEDGNNDVFFIKNIEYFPNSTLTMYNRWGNQVFQAEAYQNDWKGTFGDQKLPDGTYFYVLDIKGQKQRSGYVELRR